MKINFKPYNPTLEQLIRANGYQYTKDGDVFTVIQFYKELVQVRTIAEFLKWQKDGFDAYRAANPIMYNNDPHGPMGHYF